MNADNIQLHTLVTRLRILCGRPVLMLDRVTNLGENFNSRGNCSAVYPWCYGALPREQHWSGIFCELWKRSLVALTAVVVPLLWALCSVRNFPVPLIALLGALRAAELVTLLTAFLYGQVTDFFATTFINLLSLMWRKDIFSNLWHPYCFCVLDGGDKKQQGSGNE